MKLNDLIAILKRKRQQGNPDVEFIVCKPDGTIITMDLNQPNIDIIEISKLFSGRKK